MSLSAIPLDRSTAPVAAALHAVAGLHEAWGEDAISALLTSPEVAGDLVVTRETRPRWVFVLWRVAVDEAEILTICVSPESRRRGLGRWLLDRAWDRARAQGAAQLILEVAIDNHPALALYKAAGFQATGRRPRYYKTDHGIVDALIMAKNAG